MPAREWTRAALGSAGVPSTLRRWHAVRAELELVCAEHSELRLFLPGEGLPGWLAAVAAGGGEATLGIPETGGDDASIPDALLDLVEAARSLGAAIWPDRPLPVIRPPHIELMGSTLVASRAAQFSITVTHKHPETGLRFTPCGPDWDEGTAIIPAALCRALDDLERGPPARGPDQADSDWTDSRYLWWAQLRERLVVAKQQERASVEVQGVLAKLFATVWDQITPRPRVKDHRLDLLVDPGPVIDELTGSQTNPSATDAERDALVERLLDQISARPDLHPNLSSTSHNGRRSKVRVVMTDNAREAVQTMNGLRSRLAAATGPDRSLLLAQLQDAPDTLLDPALFNLDGFDLSEFSDRVLGIEAVPSVYYARPSASEERWRFVNSAGNEIGPGSGDLSPQQWAAIWARLREAAAGGRSYVHAEGFWFRVPPEAVLRGGLRAEPPPPRAELVVATNIDEVATSWEDLGDGVVVPRLPSPPPGLSANYRLFEHQRVGLRWLAGHASWDERSTDHGLLADDMGLGKTLQVLSLMAHLNKAGRLSPMLLVAPLSLLANWRSEAQGFFPGAFDRPLLVGGTSGIKHPTAEMVGRAQWTLMSYESLRRHQLELGRVRFQLMVLDESHRIKNPTAGVTRAALAMQADRRIALTGTPVQNRLADLWSQFDWLSPGWLGDLTTFDLTYADEGNEDALKRLAERVGSRILRRLKRKTLGDDLPPLHDEGARYRPRLSMTAPQASLYEAVLRDKSADGSQGSFGMMHRLFQVCACPRLVGEPDMKDPKHDWLMNLLDEIAAKGEKALVFAEWYALQDALVDSIGRRFGVSVDRVNGKVEAGDRLQRVDRFNAAPGFGVLVLGPKAAGVGLNITGANHVVHYTRHWNPANEAQATDRAYRIGATRPVHVYRPLLEHPRQTSIEVHLDGLLRQKSALAEQVIVPTASLSVSADLKTAVFS